MKPDGGSAFPMPRQEARTESWQQGTGGGGTWFPPIPGQPGMTLRDYFAAAAMNAIICTWANSGAKISAEPFAQQAYVLADAMLAERAK